MDLEAKLRDEPACAPRSPGRRWRRPRTRCRSTPPVATTTATTRCGDCAPSLTATALGFDAFKIKVGERRSTSTSPAPRQPWTWPAPDRARRRRQRTVRREAAQTYGRALAPYGLRWFEEPGDLLDYALLRQLIDGYAGPVATGENLFSAADAENLVRFGGMRPEVDVIQVDPGLSYGITEYLRVLDRLEAHGFDRTRCFPHGGHLINLHVVVGLGLGGCEAYPGVFGRLRGYALRAPSAGARWRPATRRGSGWREKPDLASHLAAMVEDLA
ncbi:MAG: enolase C-terminal domain-like protein [Acidimicrobiales bacterium]